MRLDAESGRRAVIAAVAALNLVGCYRAAPPSVFPNAEAALERMHASQACSRAVTAEGKLSYSGDNGSARGNLLYIAQAPAQIRLDVFSPFGAAVETLTTDGQRFTLFDLRARTFSRGAANACNLQRFTRVPLSPEDFVELLRGEAPVLPHAPQSARISWQQGRYVVEIAGGAQLSEEIRLIPTDADYALPYAQQRVHVLGVKLSRAGTPLYEVELSEHAPGVMGQPRADPDGIEPPLQPSGPECRADLPHALHFVVGHGQHDVRLWSEDITHNPPIQPGVFVGQPPGGVTILNSDCPAAVIGSSAPAAVIGSSAPVPIK